MSKKFSNVKKCYVPMCSSSTKATPDKLFTTVPQNPIIREIWYKNVNKTYSNSLPGTATIINCCEDHFNFDDDLKEVNQERKIFTVKDDVIPHLIQCQEDYKNELMLPSKPPSDRMETDRNGREFKQIVYDGNKRLTLIINSPKQQNSDTDSDVSLSSLSTISSVSSTGLKTTSNSSSSVSDMDS